MAKHWAHYFLFTSLKQSSVRNHNQCYRRAGIPPKFPPWGEYRKSRTFPDSSLLILQSWAGGDAMDQTSPGAKPEPGALERARFGAQLCQDRLGELRPSCFNPDEPMETFPDAAQVILQTCKFYLIKWNRSQKTNSALQHCWEGILKELLCWILETWGNFSGSQYLQSLSGR